MRPISPKEVMELRLKTKVWLCEPGEHGTIRKPVYVFRRSHKTRIEIRYLDDDGIRVLLPWSLDTNKPINNPKLPYWLEYRA